MKSQASKVLKKAVQGGIALEDTFTDNPFTAYNHTRFSISKSSMELLAKIANMKIANPGRTRDMITGGQFSGSFHMILS